MSAAQASPASRKYLWDFFGPNAERTAAHFEKHLLEFLEEHEHVGVTTGLESAGEGHHAAYCLAGSELGAELQAALRPNRAVAV